MYLSFLVRGRPIRWAHLAVLKDASSNQATNWKWTMGKVPKPGAEFPKNFVAAELRMMPGLYWHRITARSGKQFLEDVWKVAPEADRIEYRFKGGRSLEFNARTQAFGAGSDPSNIVDACYPYVVGFQQRF